MQFFVYMNRKWYSENENGRFTIFWSSSRVSILVVIRLEDPQVSYTQFLPSEHQKLISSHSWQTHGTRRFQDRPIMIKDNDNLILISFISNKDATVSPNYFLPFYLWSIFRIAPTCRKFFSRVQSLMSTIWILRPAMVAQYE